MLTFEMGHELLLPGNALTLCDQQVWHLVQTILTQHDNEMYRQAGAA
jgi:hypothetical protein